MKWDIFNLSYTIINVDGSCLGNLIRADYGCIVCNSSCVWRVGFSGFISGSTDILQVELYVIHQVLTLAKGMGFYDSI